jgi:DNA-binding CsgD family transcriptional regulator
MSIPIKPLKDRWNEGNPAITAYCPTCRERCVPVGDGICGWCSTPVTGPAVARWEQTREARERMEDARRRRQQGKSVALIARELQREAMTTREIADRLWMDQKMVSKAIARMRRRGDVELVGCRRTRGNLAGVYALREERAV